MRSGADGDLAELSAKARALYNAAAFDSARDAFSAIVRQVPQHAESHIYLSHIAWETGDAAASIAALDAALRLMPDNARLHLLRAERLGRSGQPQAALDAFDAAIAAAPSEIKPRADKAHHLQLLGRFDEADAIFRKLIRKHPAQGGLYRMLMAGRKARKGDPLLREMIAQWRNSALPDGSRMELGFALAKALEDTGAQDRVFAVLKVANALQRKLYPFDAARQEAEWDATRAAQDALSLIPPQSEAPLVPVFVCGMPRSGTTLVEQIVASHSRATAGGELGHALRLAWQVFGAPPGMARLSDTDAAMDLWRDRYLALARRDTGASAGALTDKSIQSHLVFGLIRQALPGARLIVVQRDPRDVALSIYRNHFAAGTHRYANDFGDIARTIKAFRRSVAWWRDRMPGVIHEIRYEDLVADPEPRARALVAAAGLDWEDACLRHHESGGAVQTLSLAQVRQPIHAGRREAWRDYESDLQPFIDAWGDAPWD